MKDKGLVLASLSPLLMVVLIVPLIIYGVTHNKNEEPQLKVVYVVNELPKFLTQSPQEGLKDALIYYDVKHPEIVYAQAVLETGHFKSDACISKNNLFGLYNSRKNEYYTFNHWTESVVAYKEYIQRRYHPPNDYYEFLRVLPYAEDPQYINKLKTIVND